MINKISPIDPYLEIELNDDCSIEQEIEYNKMLKQLNNSIDYSILPKIVKNQHLMDKISWYKDVINHSKEVAELSENLCLKLSFPSKLVKTYWVLVCKTAGYFHEVMQFGINYEELLQISDKNVVNIVSEITPDIREPTHKRGINLKNKLNQSNIYTKLVALADIHSEIEYLTKAARTTPKKLDVAFVSDQLKIIKSIIDGISEMDIQSETIKNFFSSTKRNIKIIEDKLNYKT